MKKISAFLVLFLILAGFVFAATPVMITDPYNVVATTVTKTDDATIKSGAGYVQSVLVSWAGVTAGDMIVINDDTTTVLTVVAGAAAGSLAWTPAAAIPFTTSIVYDETKSGGSFYTTIQYS